MEIREYLYVDRIRLNAYAEQIMDPTHFDRVPAWGLDLGLTGIAVSAAQSRHARDHTVHEKLEAIQEYLIGGRHLDNGGRAVFAMQELEAIRIHVPPIKHEAPSSDVGVWIWVGQVARTLITLIEDFPKNDLKSVQGGIPGAGLRSGYSALLSLITTHRTVLRNTILTPAACQEAQCQYDIWHIHPLDLLDRLGCQFAKSRPIHVLYRIRERGSSQIDGIDYEIFGYPIFIAEQG